jgi:next-to-BRCA1 protein 1
MLVRKSLRQAGFVLLAAALLMTACNMGATPAPTVDVNAVNTAAVATAMGQLSAQFTETALAAPPTSAPTDTAIALSTFPPTASGALPTVSFNSTPGAGTTPLPGFTPLASPIAPTASGPLTTANGCNDAAFVGETIPDKTQFSAGKDFSKAWQLQNTGTCTWDEGYMFAFLADVSSTSLVGRDVVIRSSDDATKPGHSQTFVVHLTAPDQAGEYISYWKMKDAAGNFFGPRVSVDIIVK